jgi:hypothetical protein
MLAFPSLNVSWNRCRRLLLALSMLSLVVLPAACEPGAGQDGGVVTPVGDPGGTGGPDQPGDGDPGAAEQPLVSNAVVTHVAATSTTPDGVARVHYPLDVTITAVADARTPVELPVLVGLYESGGGQFCLLGLVDVPVGRAEPVTVTRRFYLPPTCLWAEGQAGEGAITRTMNLYTLVDPYGSLGGGTPGQSAVYSAQALDVREPGALACRGEDGAVGCVVDLVVTDSAGVDVDVVDLALDSSVVLLRDCAPAGGAGAHACGAEDDSYDDQRAELGVRVQLDAYGLPDGEADLVTTVNALGDDELRMSFAIRPSSGAGTWMPLYLHRAGGSDQDETVFVERTLVPQGPYFSSHVLRLAACAGGDCGGPSARELMERGAWRDEVAFDVRACIDTAAEAPGLQANNCRTVKLLVLREDPDAVPQAAYPPSTSVSECDPRWKACWSKVLTGNFSLGSRSTIAVSFHYGTATRLDTDGGRTKNGAALRGALFNKDKTIFEVWAHAGVYTTPQMYNDDGDAPRGCACPDLQALRQAFTADEFMADCIEECTTTRLRCDRRTSQASRERCERSCQSMCQRKKKRQCIVASGASTGYCRAGDCNSSRDCGPGQACVNWQCRTLCTPGSFNTNQWVCQTGRSQLPDEQCIQVGSRHICATPCNEGDPEDICDGVAEHFEASCQCLAYYTVGVRAFEKDIWASEKAGGVPQWTKTVTAAKGWGQEFYFAVGPIPVVIGYRLSGEGGFTLKLGLYLQRGNRYDLPITSCATGASSSRCVTEGTATTPDDPAQPGYQNCGCDPQCRYFGDCCADYDWVCEYGFPVPAVVDPRDFNVCGSVGGGANARCQEEMAGANYAMSMAAEVVPFMRFTAALWGGVDLLIVRAVARGDFVLADISLPIAVALRIGLWGSPVVVFQMKLMGSFSVRLALSMLSGMVRIIAEHRYIKWCSWRVCFWRKCINIPYPCGFGWKEFWSMKIAEWSGLRWVWPLFDAFAVKTWDLGGGDNPFTPGPN